MAELLCHRDVKSERAAAERVKAQFRVQATERHLARLYAARRRELEIAEMRRLSTWNTRFDGVSADAWQALMERVEGLAKQDERLAALAADRHPRNPIRRLYPYELRRLLEDAGYSN
jgi:hypothetical protein